MLYPEAVLYDAGMLAKVVGGIDDINLVGSIIFFHWHRATRWAEEPLTSEGNREWFVVALSRLKELTGTEGA